MDNKYSRPVKIQSKEADKASVGHAVDSLSPREYTLQRKIDSYLKAKKEKALQDFDVVSLKKDLQRMINSYGKAVNNKRRNPLSRKIGYYYAILMDIEGKAPRPAGIARKVTNPGSDRK